MASPSKQQDANQTPFKCQYLTKPSEKFIYDGYYLLSQYWWGQAHSGWRYVRQRIAPSSDISKGFTEVAYETAYACHYVQQLPTISSMSAGVALRSTQSTLKSNVLENEILWNHSSQDSESQTERQRGTVKGRIEWRCTHIHTEISKVRICHQCKTADNTIKSIHIFKNRKETYHCNLPEFSNKFHYALASAARHTNTLQPPQTAGSFPLIMEVLASRIPFKLSFYRERCLIVRQYKLKKRIDFGPYMDFHYMSSQQQFMIRKVCESGSTMLGMLSCWSKFVPKKGFRTISQRQTVGQLKHFGRVPFSTDATIALTKPELAEKQEGQPSKKLEEVDWFPQTLNELDLIGNVLLVPTDQSGKDSVQFTDLEYRRRRDFIAAASNGYRMKNPIPTIDYTPIEHETWRYCYQKVRKLHKRAMCPFFDRLLTEMEQTMKLHQKIPQMTDLNDFLMAKTGFRIKPVAGMLSQREFLNCLAHRVFCSTQYIRHPETRDYTVQPDIVHEIVGHIAMLAEPSVADITHKIGLLSLGVTDQQISEIGSVYWFTVEFGAVKQGNRFLSYGAGVSGGVKELEHFLSGNAKFELFNPAEDIKESLVVQSVQPHYKYTDSMETAFRVLVDYGKSIPRKVNVHYDPKNKVIVPDREVKMVSSKRAGLLF